MKLTATIVRRIVTSGQWRRSLGLVILFAIGCALLSWWQFARRDETAAANALIAKNWAATPAPLDVALPGGRYLPENAWRPVRLTGIYLTSEQLLVRNRSLDGNPGFEILTPLSTPDGTVFIVDRGWISVGTTGLGTPSTVPAPPSGSVTVVARLQPAESTGGSITDGQVNDVDLTAVRDETGDRTVVSAYGQMIVENPSVTPVPTSLPRPSFDEGMHLSYALQWILFAFAAFGALAWSVRRDLRDAGDPEVLAADERAEVRRSRRPPSDESAEDALLTAHE